MVQVVNWGDLRVQVVNWGDLLVQDLHGENCIRKIWVLVPFVNIFMEYYSPLLLLYICFNMGQCAATAFVNIFIVYYCRCIVRAPTIAYGQISTPVVHT